MDDFIISYLYMLVNSTKYKVMPDIYEVFTLFSFCLIKYNYDVLI
jgi:hypothetical protein